MTKIKASFKQLYRAIRKLDIYQDSLISLELFLGLYPQRQNYVAKMKFWFYFVMFFGFVVCCIAAPICNWNGYETLRDVDIVPPCCQIIFTALAYKFRLKHLDALFIDAERFWSLDMFDTKFQAYLQAKYYKVARYIYAYKTGCTLATWHYYLKPLFGRNVESRSIWDSLCGIENISCYMLSLVIQYYCVTNLLLNVIIFDGMFTAFLLKIFMQLRMIRYKLENLNFSEDSRITKQTLQDLVTIIIHHSFVLNYINKFNKFYSIIILSEFVSTICSLCMGLFLLTLEKTSLKNLLFFAPYLASLYTEMIIFYQGGQMLLDECEGITKAIYCCNWFEADVSVQKMILLMLIRSQKLGRLTVGGVCNTDLTVYLKVSKTAFSFYTLVKQFYPE